MIYRPTWYKLSRMFSIVGEPFLAGGARAASSSPSFAPARPPLVLRAEGRPEPARRGPAGTVARGRAGLHRELWRKRRGSEASDRAARRPIRTHVRTR